jgi:signal peptidase I
MNFDFQAIMVLALLLTGVLWAIDAFIWKPRRQRKAENLKQQAQDNVDDEKVSNVLKEPLLVEYARSFFPIILIVLLLRSFLFEPFRIPSGSMIPTLLVGDFILVNKYSYGIRLPLLGSKIVDIGEPKRGDIVVFRFPKDPSIDYIKRIIGLPGDRISYIDKTVYVNGKPAQQETLGVYTGMGSGLSMSGASHRIEHLDGVDHEILVQTLRRPMDSEFEVPADHYFVMGDNRDNSNDSRFWGFVPEENLVGKAFMIWMNWDSAKGGVTWERIGSSIK